jgi:hypothetical protein
VTFAEALFFPCVFGEVKEYPAPGRRIFTFQDKPEERP